MEVLNVNDAPCGYVLMFVRPEPGCEKDYQGSIKKEVMITPSPTVYASRHIFVNHLGGKAGFEVIAQHDYTPKSKSGGRVVLGDGRFLFDHVGSTSEAPALVTCLSVIYGLIHPTGAYHALVSPLFPEGSWDTFAARMLNTFEHEASAASFPDPYVTALVRTFGVNKEAVRSVFNE